MDLQHTIGNDFNVDISGGLAISDGAQEDQERVLRRLLTNPTSLFNHLVYGAGLAEQLGKPMSKDRIYAKIRQQMRLEKAVTQSPPPLVNVQTDSTGLVIANIQYVDRPTGLSSSLVVPVSG